MTWTREQIRELYRAELQEVCYAVRHSDPTVTSGLNAPNQTVSCKQAQEEERRRRREA